MTFSMLSHRLWKPSLLAAPSLSRRMSTTVYALSSAPGRAGVAVIRMTGPRTKQVLEAVTRRRVPKARMAAVRQIVHPVEGNLLDEGVVLYFPGPRSFTGEDCGELQVHGGNAVVQSCLQAIADAGALVGKDDDNAASASTSVRTAEPGEFTMRALLNGKMDATAVEGIGDLIAAETEQQRRVAVEQMSGRLGELYEGWRRQLLSCLANLEANIDFGEDADLDSSRGQLEQVRSQVADLSQQLNEHLSDGRRGELLRDGFRVSISGPPNAGKSSLLNSLCDRQAAIVSSQPGTTRDVVEVALDVGGYPVRLADTAGIRKEASDIVEEEGIRRAHVQMSTSDIRLCVVDVTKVHSDCADTNTFLDLLRAGDSAAKCDVLLLNKSDLVGEDEVASTREELLATMGPTSPIVMGMCATSTSGITHVVGQLEELLCSAAGEGEGTTKSVMLTRERHRNHVSQCIEHLDEFNELYLEEDLAAEELRQAAACLGRITGRVGVEDMLDILFHDFCIGK